MSKMSINIKKINIIVETNIEGEAPFSLTYDKIYNPVKSRVIKSQTKLDYPYFTTDIQYNEKTLYNLAKKDYSELLRAFFDKRYFTTMVKSFEKNNNRDNRDGIVLPTPELITNHNIFMMLYFLFPIRYPIPANISSTYNSKICKNSAEKYQVDLKNKPASNTLSSIFLGQTKDIQEENMREYSYINTSKGESTVTQIVWLNDILNEPRYRELMDSLIQYNEWYADKILSLPKEIEDSQKKYFDELISDNSNTLVFTQDDIKVIRDQKKTGYDLSKYIDDIEKIISKFFVLNDNVPEKVNINKAKKNLLSNINSFYKSYIKNNISSEIPIDTLYDFIIYNLFNKCTDNSSVKHNSDKYSEQYASTTDDQPITGFILSYYVKNGSIEINGLDKVKLQKFNDKRFDIEDKIVNEIIKILDAIATIKETDKDTKTKTEQMMKKFLEKYTNTKYDKIVTNDNNSKIQMKQFLYKILKNLINTKTKDTIEELYKNDLKSEFGDDKKNKFKDEYFLNDEYSYTVNLLKFLNDSNILDPFKEELNTKLEKYNVFAVDRATDKLLAQYKDIDIQIDKIIKLFEEYNIIKDEYSKLIKKKYEESDAGDLFKTAVDILFKTAMNIIDSLKPLLSDQNVERMRLTGTSSIQIKVEKNLKITNEIKVLKLVNEYLFGKQVKGINLYYDKEQTKSNIEILNELKKEKYFFFTNIVKFIKDNFVNVNRESTNIELKTMMNNYFNNINDDFITKIVQPAKDAINSNVEKLFCNRLFNTLVTKTRPTNNQKDPEFEINIYMEVIRGKLDYQTQQNIKCDYRDDNLAVLFNELTTNPNEFEFMKKTNAIELPKAVKDIKQIAIENTVPPIPPVAPPAPQVRGGLRKRKTRKHQRRNYNFTRRRVNFY